MVGCLSKSQVEYVLYHLFQHIEKTFINQNGIQIVHSLSPDLKSKSIVFPLSAKPLKINETFHIDDVPILFPLSSEKQMFSLNKYGHLVFEHDLLKSAFVLLSGYQEQAKDSVKDQHGRFQYAESLQRKLNISFKPLVNYYFEIIIKGLEAFSHYHNLNLIRIKAFDSFGFFLSHDVDLIRYYSLRNMVYRWAQIVGLRQPNYKRSRLLKAAVSSILPSVFPFIKKDPFWSFESMRELEKELNFTSSWYFLNQDGSPEDAQYRFSSRKLRKLILELCEDGCEIGLHGSFRSTNDKRSLKEGKHKLEDVLGLEVKGVRQHFLKVEWPKTQQIQQGEGFQYDASMGFSELEGFRNSYCMPFHPFDFEKDEMMEIWEIPLLAMDVTLFNHREHSFSSAKQSVVGLIEEVVKFNGLFSLLWHNSFFDEFEFPGITFFYRNLLKEIALLTPESVTGIQCVQKLTGDGKF